MNILLYATIVVYCLVFALSLLLGIMVILGHYPYYSPRLLALQYWLIAIIAMANALVAKSRPIVSDIIWVSRGAWGILVLLTLVILISNLRLAWHHRHPPQLPPANSEKS